MRDFLCMCSSSQKHKRLHRTRELLRTLKHVAKLRHSLEKKAKVAPFWLLANKGFRFFESYRKSNDFNLDTYFPSPVATYDG